MNEASLRALAERGDEVLAMATEALDNGRDPFEKRWLVEHKITYNECLGLANHLATIARGYLRAGFEERMTIMLLGAEDNLSPSQVKDIVRQLRPDLLTT